MTLDELLGVRLTDEQRAIVNYPLQPLRVVAGAGTGKTTTVVARIAAHVNGGMSPDQALGITFTNKAAEELATRLRTALHEHSREGREVEVTTYHGFARRLLQEFGPVVGVERDAGVIGPGFVRQLLLESLDEDTYSHLDLTAPANRVNDAAVLARRLADHLTDAAAVATLDTDPADPVSGKRRELAGIVARYETAKRRLGVVDYGDLISTAHRLAQDHRDIARRIRERYRLLVLDEYQDTDPAQRSLLQLIFGDGFPVTAVGDEDQTIYEWRGASTANFRSFPSHFPNRDRSEAETLHLTLNRRSARRIIDVANAIRGELRPEAGVGPLRPQPDARPGDVELRHFRTAGEEAAWIATEVKRRHEEDGVPWREIGVLFRKNRSIAAVRDALDAEDVPLEVVSLGGLLDVPHVADLHAWLRLLGRPEDSAALVRILLADRYRLGFGEIAPLVSWIRSAGRASETDDGPGWPLVEAIDRLHDVAELGDETSERLEEFRTVYRELLVAAQATSLSELCRRILDAAQMWAEVDALGEAARLSARLNLYRFLDLAEEWSPLQGRPSLDAFLGYLDLLLEERATDELDTARVSGEDAVALLTVHRAKGLEWDTVVVPALAETIFPARSLGFDNPHTSPSSLPYELRIDADSLPALTGNTREDAKALRSVHDAQEWRTAYVAVTRAKQRLLMTAAHWYTTRTSRNPSPLYALAAAVPGVAETRPPTDPGDPPSLLATVGAPAPDPLFTDGWAAALRRATIDPGAMRALDAVDAAAYDDAVEQIEMMLDGLPEPPPVGATDEPVDVSVTGLVTLAQCPRRFEWTEIDALPRRRSSAQTRGIELHRKIELHNRGVVAFDDLDEDLYDLPEHADAAPVRDGFATFLESRFARERPRWTEAAIDLRLDAGRVRGRIDAVYASDDRWEIVDFKSGRAGSDPARRVQLEAYAVAAVDGALGPAPPDDLRVSFVYLGGGTVDVETEHADTGWLDRARTRLEELVGSARRDVYEPRPGDACRRCDFVSFCNEGRTHLETAQTS